MEVTVNGETRSVPAGLTLAGLLDWLGIDRARVAVEMNRQIVRQGQWDTVEVGGGAQLEIVQFVGGG